jgi:hypothetical protein
MTSYYSSRKPIGALRRSDKILITLFSVTLAVALTIGVVNYHQRTSLTIQGTQDWYRGNEADANPESLKFAKTPLELLDVTHPHLFFQTIMFFILCHIFSLTQVAERWKVAIYVVSFVSVLTEALFPWLIRYMSGFFAPFLIASTTIMTVTILILLVVPIKEMWWPRAESAAGIPHRPRRRRHFVP